MPRAKKQPRTPRKPDSDAEFAIRYAKAGMFSKLFHNLIWAGAVCFCVWQMTRVVQSLSGKDTVANILVGVVYDFRVKEFLAVGLGCGGVIYGMVQRRLRREKVRDLAAHTAYLEKLLDATRTSSGVTGHGLTREEDEHI